MSENPYAPPSAPVADVSAPPMQRPRQVVLAIQLAVVSYALGVAIVYFSWEDYYAGLQSLSAMLWTQAITLAIFAWLYAKIYAGRNWARITAVVLTLLSMLATFDKGFVAYVKAAPILVQLAMLLSFIANIAFIWLVMFSPGREWFRKR